MRRGTRTCRRYRRRRLQVGHSPGRAMGNPPRPLRNIHHLRAAEHPSLLLVPSLNSNSGLPYQRGDRQRSSADLRRPSPLPYIRAMVKETLRVAPRQHLRDSPGPLLPQLLTWCRRSACGEPKYIVTVCTYPCKTAGERVADSAENTIFRLGVPVDLVRISRSLAWTQPRQQRRPRRARDVAAALTPAREMASRCGEVDSDGSDFVTSGETCTTIRAAHGALRAANGVTSYTAGGTPAPSAAQTEPDQSQYLGLISG